MKLQEVQFFTVVSPLSFSRFFGNLTLVPPFMVIIQKFIGGGGLKIKGGQGKISDRVEGTLHFTHPLAMSGVHFL